MQISLIYARSANHCIGKAGRLPWSLPDESRFFTETTRNRPIIMGRFTYEDHKSLLPDRLNIVVSRTPQYRAAPGVHVESSLEDALALAGGRSDEVFIIGGARVLADAMPLAGRVFETIVDADVEGDVYLPAFDFTGWQSILLHRHAPDRRHRYGYSTYRRERAH